MSVPVIALVYISGRRVGQSTEGYGRGIAPGQDIGATSGGVTGDGVTTAGTARTGDVVRGVQQ